MDKKTEGAELCAEEEIINGAEAGSEGDDIADTAEAELEKNAAVLQTQEEEYTEQRDTMSEDAENEGEEKSVEYSLRVRELEEENKALLAELEILKQKAISKEDIMARLSEQEREVQKKLPDFSLGDEMSSPLFFCLAEHIEELGISLERIYELSHFDEVLESRAATAAEKKEREMISELKTRWQRPGENGLKRAESTGSRRVSEMTRKERAELAARAAGGAYIKL